MKSPKKYNDFWVKIIGSLVASQVIDLLNREESYFQRLTSIYFYIDLLGGFLIALFLWEITRRIICYLDKRYDWLAKPLQRIPMQLLLAVAFPALLSFFCTFAFMRFAYNQDIFQTTWLYNEFYVVIIIILLINVVYFTWWLYLEFQTANHTGINTDIITTNKTPVSGDTTTIEVSKAGKTVLLPHTSIAFAYLSNGYCYLKTFEGESYLTTYALDEVAHILDESIFFRANRQVLINRRTCRAYKSIENGKIELELDPRFKEPVIVSQKRARDFRKWISVGSYA
jgi:hypothetical protein